MIVMAQLEVTDPLYVPPWRTNEMYTGTRTNKPTYATAFAEYTGIPSAVGGGAGAVGINVANQGVQVRTGTSIFSRVKYGFRVAWALESVVGAMIFAGVLTVIDPQDKWEGGLDEWIDYGPSKDATNPFTTGNFTHPRSGYTPQAGSYL